MPNHDTLLSQMTLEEKCSLLSGKTQFTTQALPRLSIPSMTLSDGPHGLRRQAGGADHLGLQPSLPATCYPTAAAMANSWDPALGEELGRFLGRECAAQRVHVLLGPGLNLKRSPLCGRNFEYFSEDPYLAGKLAAAYIRGIQSQGVAACPKHFAANSQERLRLHSDSVVDQRTLRELYLTAFEIAVQEGRPKCVMSAYNRVNGTYASENRQLLQDILVDEWGFQGFTVTDWGGGCDRVAALRAGTHLEMPATAGDSDRQVARAVRLGVIPQSLLDQRVDTYLTVLSDTVRPSHTPEAFDVEAHHAFARQAAAASAVLLKNEGGILPLSPGTRVAVIGPFARVPRFQGAGSSVVSPTAVDLPLHCLSAAGLEVVGYAEGFPRHGGGTPAARAAACALARQADVVLLYLGLDEQAETEGRDRTHLSLLPCQGELLKELAAVNPSIVVLLCGGAPVELPWLPSCKALLYGSLSGQGGAGAAADLLTGRVNPSGKLAESWPLTLQDVPNASFYPGQERTAEYREGPFVGYRYYQTVGAEVRFPFGFGLSYTTFSYSALSLTQKAVTFTLTNTGNVAGAEIAQVYVGREESLFFRPKLELKGFQKVFLRPGESRILTIPLDDKAFRSFHPRTQRWEVEGGLYRVWVGPSCQELPLTAQVAVAGTDAPPPYSAADLPSYYSGRVSGVSDREFERLLGRPLPPARWDRTAPLEQNDTLAQLFYAKSPLGRLVHHLLTARLKRAEAAGTPDLTLLFLSEIPFRGLAKLSGGRVSMDMSDALLEVCNGHFFRGAAHLLSSWLRKGREQRRTRAALAQARRGAPHP